MIDVSDSEVHRGADQSAAGQIRSDTMMTYSKKGHMMDISNGKVHREADIRKANRSNQMGSDHDQKQQDQRSRAVVMVTTKRIR